MEGDMVPRSHKEVSHVDDYIPSRLGSNSRKC